MVEKIRKEIFTNNEKENYISYLKQNGINNSADLSDYTCTIEDIKIFLQKKGINDLSDLSREAITEYILQKRLEKADLPVILKILAGYSHFIGNELLCTEIELLQDASNVMNKLSEITQESYGDEVWGKIFNGIKMPEIGLTLDEMSRFTKEIEKRYLSVVSKKEYEASCEKVAHCWKPDWDINGRENFLKIKNIDALCEQYNHNLLRNLEKCRDDHTLFFTQIVDDGVIDYIRENPCFYRKGSKIYVRKIPFSTKRFLSEKDNRLKRYHVCHCPWARNSILQDGDSVSDSFCHCSLGLDKKGFEVAFDRPLTGRIISSALNPNELLCIFEIDIPDDILQMYT